MKFIITWIILNFIIFLIDYLLLELFDLKFHDKFIKICKNLDHECFLRNVIVRLATTNFFCLFILSIILYMNFNFRLNKITILKSFLFFLTFNIFFLNFDNYLFEFVFPLTIIIGGVWLFFESVCVIDLAHQINRYFLTQADKLYRDLDYKSSFFYRILHLLLCLISIIGYCYSFSYLYFQSKECLYLIKLLNFILSINLLLNFVSLTKIFNKGLFVSSLVSLYSLCIFFNIRLSINEKFCDSFTGENYSIVNFYSLVLYLILYIVTLFYGLVLKKNPEVLVNFLEFYNFNSKLTNVSLDSIESEGDFSSIRQREYNASETGLYDNSLNSETLLLLENRNLDYSNYKSIQTEKIEIIQTLYLAGLYFILLLLLLLLLLFSSYQYSEFSFFL